MGTEIADRSYDPESIHSDPFPCRKANIQTREANDDGKNASKVSESLL
jgi:hypothetical protein